MTPALLGADPAELAQAADERAARNFFLPFVKLTKPNYEVNRVALVVAEALEWFEREVMAGKSPRLILEIPPRVGKSELVSRRFPPWLLGRHPDWNIALVSYGAELAESLSKDARSVVMQEEYGRIFTRLETEEVTTVELDKSAKAAHQWRIKPSRTNPQPGGVTATGIKGTLTGRGFQVFVIDDPHKDWEEANSRAAKDRVWNFYTGTAYDRLEPGGGIIIVQQRWAVDDLVGRVLDGSDSDVDDEGFDVTHVDQWRVIRLPAQAEPGEPDALGREPGEWLPARYTPEQWERAKANNNRRNPRVWQAKFQQRPVPQSGGIFQPFQWLRFEDDDPEENEGPVYVFGDTSYAKRTNSDFNCFGVWRYEQRHWVDREHGRSGEFSFRLLEVYRQRSQFPRLRIDLADMAFRYGLIRPANVLDFSSMQPRIWIEDKGSGQSLIQEFMVPVTHPEKGLVRLPIAAWNPQKDHDKDARAHTASEIMYQGAVVFPRKLAGLDHLLRTLTEFQGEGSVEFDDEIDMVSMSLILMGQLRPVKRRTVQQVRFEMVS